MSGSTLLARAMTSIGWGGTSAPSPARSRTRLNARPTPRTCRPNIGKEILLVLRECDLFLQNILSDFGKRYGWRSACRAYVRGKYQIRTYEIKIEDRYVN